MVWTAVHVAAEAVKPDRWEDILQQTNHEGAVRGVSKGFLDAHVQDTYIGTQRRYSSSTIIDGEQNGGEAQRE
jgi:hypothetical protein